MKLRVIPFISVMLALLVCSAVLADDRPPMDIPVYPGGDSTMELNLTNEDLLPMFKAMLPMLSGRMGKIAEKLDPVELADALKDVKRIEVRQVSVSKAGATESKVAEFYSNSVAQGNWNKVFWQSEASTGTLALYVKGGGAYLYGFRVQSVMVDGKPVRQAMILKTEGKIDVVKLITLGAKVMGKS